jgi:PemK-like protein.
MTDAPFQRGDVVWHPAPFKSEPAERPFLILSGPSHPFHGSEYAVVGLTRTKRPTAIELGRVAWELGDPGEESYASPWYLFTLKHDNIIRPKGSLTSQATEKVATAVASLISVEP